jgi:hypothetical protein
VTTADVAIVASAVVGIAGVLSPAITAELDRRQTRALERAQRRRETYLDLARFLEAERLKIEKWTDSDRWKLERREPPERVSDLEWVALRASVAVLGSAAVKAGLDSYHETELPFFEAVMGWLAARADVGEVELDTAVANVERIAAQALKRIDDVEAAMRNELSG